MGLGPAGRFEFDIANLARRIGLLNAVHGVPTDVILARNAGPSHLKSHNVILASSRRSNPWVELFEEQFNFRTRVQETPLFAYFENSVPLAGEEQQYGVEWGIRGHCRVAYLPNLDSTGSVLIISGTDMASTDAGVEFITDDQWVRRLRSALELIETQIVRVTAVGLGWKGLTHC